VAGEQAVPRRDGEASDEVGQSQRRAKTAATIEVARHLFLCLPLHRSIHIGQRSTTTTERKRNEQEIGQGMCHRNATGSCSLLSVIG
jgi:hypothetical protein